MEINVADIVLCEFYFSDLRTSKLRPVLVLRDNLPHDDFLAVPISSQIKRQHEDELIIDNTMLEYGQLPEKSKGMLRKTFVVSKSALVKKYGQLNSQTLAHCKARLCQYLGCKSR